MTDIVDPKVVRNALPAPLPSDPPQVFDDKTVALASWYQGFIDDLNLATGHTNQNAQATHEFADAVQLLWQQVRDGVITIQQALAAIQAGPVVSVMGRSGVVTGLVDGLLVVPNGANLDTIITDGHYRYNEAVNGPVGVAFSSLLVVRSADTCAQIVVDYQTGQMHFRGGSGIGSPTPSWRPWARSMNAFETPTVVPDGVIDCRKGTSFYMNMAGNTSLSLINAPAGTTYSCELEILHRSGSFVLPANATWSNGAAPEFTQGKVHLIYFRKTNTSPNFWLMSALPNY